MKSKLIAIIPARSGSKGLPNKNVLMLIDRPLIAYTIEAAIESNVFDKVIVTTDSKYYGSIAEKYGKTVAQVILHWQIQNDILTIPKSVHLDRIRQNFNVFDFELSQNDLDTIAKLDRFPNNYGPNESTEQVKRLSGYKA